MTKKGYQVGDLVKLKSGGPVMTVSEIVGERRTVSDNETVKCKWFAGKKQEQGYFDPDTLEPSDGE